MMEEEKKMPSTEPVAESSISDKTSSQHTPPLALLPLHVTSSSSSVLLLASPVAATPMHNHMHHPLALPPTVPLPYSHSPELLSPSPMSPNYEDDDESDSGNDSDHDDDASNKEKLKSLYQRPLIYYKRVSSLTSSSNVNQSSIPSQIFLPDGTQMLGMPAHQGSEAEDENLASLMVFSLPTEEMRARRRILALLLQCLIVVDLILVSLIFSHADWLLSTSFNDGTLSTLTFVTVLLILMLGLFAIRLRDTRLLTLFSVLFYIDAAINLLRVFNVLQIAHFVLELACGLIATQLKYTIQPTWFVPQSN